MEAPTKRGRFETDQEAEDYLDSLGNLPLEVWINILSVSPSFSVQDIQRMCRVNKTFRSLCQDGVIWDEIFKKQFGIEAFEKASKVNSPYLNVSLLRLMAARCMLSTHPRYLPLPRNTICTLNDSAFTYKGLVPKGLRFILNLKWINGAYVAIIHKDQLWPIRLENFKSLWQQVKDCLAEFVRDHPHELHGPYDGLFNNINLDLSGPIAEEDMFLHPTTLQFLMFMMSRGWTISGWMHDVVYMGCMTCPTSTLGCHLCQTPICSEICLDKHTCK